MDGIINVYKERDFTSFDVVAKLRGILKQKKIGHTGTLDPMAEGVLPVCVGKATKVCDLLTDKDKVYETVLLLGKTTDTQDISGEVLQENDVNVNFEQVEEAILSFVGEYQQIPPMYSALKVNGKKLCDLARAGIEVERKSRPVTIYDIEILSMELPRVRMKVHCSKGTYIRTLCQDIGDRLQTGGCMESLLRTKVAGFMLEDALTLSQIEEIVHRSEVESILLPVDQVFDTFAAVRVKKQFDSLLYNGNKLSTSCFQDVKSPKPDQRIKVYDSEQHFIGIYQYQSETDIWKPVKMFFVP